MNREHEIRKAFFNALNSILISMGPVPIYDNKAEENSGLYILIEGQTARDTGDFRTRRWECTVTLSINHKQDISYTRDIVDEICDSVEGVITPGNNNNDFYLPTLTGWHVTNLYLSNVSYADFAVSSTQVICSKYITFNLIITKI